MAGKKNEGTEKGKTESEVNPFTQALIALTMGIIFGILLEKGRVYEPEIIRQQMAFEKFVMLKMFVAACASSMMVFSILTMTPSAHKQTADAYENFAQPLTETTILASAVGAFLLGAGMTLSGACPGMLSAQIGAGVPSAVYTLAGAFTGTLMYTNIHPWLPTSFKRERPDPPKRESGCPCARKKPEKQEKPDPPKRLDEYTGWDYFIMAIPLATTMGTFLFVLERSVPWDTEVTQSGDENNMMSLQAWPPYLTGALIGLLQFPAVLVLSDSLGSSGAYTTVIAQLSRVQCFMKTPFVEYLDNYMYGMLNWWQVFLLVGVAAGAYISSTASSTYATVPGVLPEFAFGGGMLLLIGSRLAGGCTSGHGLSGAAMLVTHSLVAVLAMFTGGICTAALLKYWLEMTFSSPENTGPPAP